LRPFEVVLLEIVPAGQKPSLDRDFEERPLPTSFAVASRDLEITAERVQPTPRTADATNWTILKPSSAVSAGGATLTPQDDGSLLATGKISSPDTYTITADTSLTSITGLRVEALPDDGLPGRGPGRAVNGNFTLAEIRVKAFSGGKPEQAVVMHLRNPKADFQQETYGGWLASEALDSDPKTGWSIDPEEGQPHEIVFETQASQAAGFEGGTTMVVELDQGDREHSLGRFRLSATSAQPVPTPERREQRLVVRGQAPGTADGDLLVVTVEMSRDGKPLEMGNIGTLFSAEGLLNGQPTSWHPVWNRRTYPSSWQAWRLPLPSSPQPADFELTIVPRVGSNISLRCTAHYLPQ
jgi:hypothetical protein